MAFSFEISFQVISTRAKHSLKNQSLNLISSFKFSLKFNSSINTTSSINYDGNANELLPKIDPKKFFKKFKLFYSLFIIKKKGGFACAIVLIIL